MRRSVSYGLAAALGAGALTGGAVAWAAADKSVTITVDGQAQHLHTTAGTVGGALADAGLRIDSHDVVAPATNAKLADDSDIVVRRGRLLHLTVDGVARNVWVTEPTVTQALADLGYGDAKLESVSRSTRLPLTPTTLALNSAKQVTVVHDGATQTVTTTDETVANLLTDLHIDVAATDQLAPIAGTELTNGLRVVLRRVTTASVTSTVAVPFATQQQTDPTMTKGKTAIVTPGVNGSQNVVYAVTYIDGVAANQVAVSTTPVSAPQAQVVKVGTKAAPAVSATPATPAAPRSTSGLNWAGVAKCESNNHWNDNTGNGYYGGLQFSISTWLSNGGGAYAPRPDLATEAQQIDIANRLYAARGSAPWPVCGKYL
jgi:uncharacterized protein YabE (DUF348 family)